jgi:hypothetical protein
VGNGGPCHVDLGHEVERRRGLRAETTVVVGWKREPVQNTPHRKAFVTRTEEHMGQTFAKEWEYDMRMFIAVAEACQREDAPSHSWHVLDWMSWKNRIKYPMVRKCDQVINWDGICS